jgi:hypothetical protein
MWILTSLGRPGRIRDTVDSYSWGGHSSVLLTLYEKDPKLRDYLAQEWPDCWHIEIVPMLGNGPTYNEILRRYPDEENYGFLADDVLLNTPGMLAELERSAGNWHIAYSNDQHHGELIPTMPCIGGDLVRSIGYLSPPNFEHWGIDVVWGEFGKRMGLLSYRPDLVYTHLNPIWGTAEDDRTYQLARQRSFGFHDIYRIWLIGGEFERARARVSSAMRAKAA